MYNTATSSLASRKNKASPDPVPHENEPITHLNLPRMGQNNPGLPQDIDGLVPKGLQEYILSKNYKFAASTLSYKGRPGWYVGDVDPKESELISSARKAGFTNEDFKDRNGMISKKNEYLKIISNMNNAVLATYVTSSNYFNTPLRASLNPSHQQGPQPDIKSMKDIIGKYVNESNSAAYSRGYSLSSTTDAMKDLGRMHKKLQISLLNNYISDNKTDTSSLRGVSASRSFAIELLYHAKNNAILKTDQFFSTTTFYNVAHEFAAGTYDELKESDNSKVIFLVKGRSGGRVSAELDEGEILYSPETYFKISPGGYMSKMRHLGATVYNLEEVPAPKDMETVTPFLSDVRKIVSVKRRPY